MSLIDQLLGGYNDLPEPVKQIYTPKEYLWLSDQEKTSLVQRETEPEIEEP